MFLRAQRVPVRRLATLSMVPAAAFAVHQLRYWLAFGGHAGIQLQRQGHAYLHSLAPWVVLLIAVAASIFLRALGRALGGKCSLSRYTLSFAALWLTCSACLIALYVTQELLESFFATGHPAGLVGVFGYGGWWSVPAAVCVGLVLAAVFHCASWLLHEVADWRARPLTAARLPLTRTRPPLTLPFPRLAPLAGGWSGRGPPR
jgi:hypothetical protein